jgi:hypothetical protein
MTPRDDTPADGHGTGGAGWEPAFPCGHERAGRNVLVFKQAKSPGGTAARCRQCHNAFQLMQKRAGAGALRLVVQMHVEGTLSEGQVSAATGMDRVEVRRRADKARAAPVQP